MFNRFAFPWLANVGRPMSRAASHSRPVHDLFEHLESRTLLSFMGPTPEYLDSNNNLEGYQTSTLLWNGRNINVIQNSWVLTFNSTLGKAQAAAKAQQVAQALGVSVTQAHGSVRGRFAELISPDPITPAMIDQARRLVPDLYNIEPNKINKTNLTPNDARYSEQWALNNSGQEAGSSGEGTIGADINAENAWNLATGSRQSIVAVIDTGVDYNHPDLRANIWRNPGEIVGNNADDDGNGFIDDIVGWDFAPGQGGNANGDNNPIDPDGHGTGVAGVIGAVGNNGLGVSGVNWNVSIIPIKIFDNNGNAPDIATINALEYVVTLKERGVDIIATNNSWGSRSDDDAQTFDPALEIAIRESTDLGVLFVASAGNTSNDNDGPIFHYPDGYNNDRIISVAATDNKDNLASFSSFGATTVDLAAPGEQILTTALNGGYTLIDGTSFSAPYVTGALALMRSVNRFASPIELRSALFSTVEPLASLSGLVATGGRLDLFAALQAIGIDGPTVTAVAPGPQTPPTNTISVQFSENINPATFDVSKIRLVRANGDAAFNSNDITVDLAPATITLADNLLSIVFPTDLPRDNYRLSLDNTGFRDLDGNFLNGDLVSGTDESYDFNIIIFRGPLETNDSIAEATPVLLDGAGNATFNDLVIGDGLYDDADVDFFRIFTPGPSLIKVRVDARALVVPSNLDPYIRLFSTAGQEIAENDNFNGLDSELEIFVEAGGFYFLGVSAFPNSAYNPFIPGSGAPGDQLGAYSIAFSVFTPGPENISKSNNTSAIIPDVSTITSTISLADGRSIADLNVRINLAHSFVGDLRITLTSPTNAVIVLVDRRGAAGDNFSNTTFDAQASTAITAAAAPFSGSFRPEGDLASLNNLPASGTWTLTIQDFKAGDFGQLISWSLDIQVINDLFGPFELNDSLTTATNSQIAGVGSRTFRASIGDGAFGLKDADLFRLTAPSGSTIRVNVAPIDPALDTIVRIFDAAGNELAIDKRKGSRDSSTSFIVSVGGIFYVGVSGGNTSQDLNFGNDSYNPLVAGSGTDSDVIGAYNLTINVSGGVGQGAIRLAGDKISLGLNPDGTLGASSLPDPTGLKLESAEFLLLAQLESFFSVIADGFIGRNAAGAQSDLPLSLINESDFSNQRASVSGVFRNLAIKRALTFNVKDQFVAVDVTLRNISNQTINDLAWVEGLNPNQGQAFTNPSSNTTNDIHPSGRLATALSNGLALGLGAPDSPFSEIASFENPSAVRDPYQVINSPSDPDATDADQTMALAFNLGSLIPNQSKTFRYFFFLGSLAQVNDAFNTLDSANGSGHLVPDPRDLALDPADLPFASYYPEGFAAPKVSTFIPMINANDESVRVVIIARYESSAAPDILFDSATDSPGGLIAPNRRFGYTATNPTLFSVGSLDRVASQIPGRPGVLKRTPYSLEIRSSLPLGATFSHFGQGVSTGEAFTSTMNTTWTFSNLEKARRVNDYVLLYNPNSIATKVTMTVYPEAGAAQSILSSTITIPAQKRGGWNFAKLLNLPNGNYAVKLDADDPVVAAVTHYDLRSTKRIGYAIIGSPGAGSTSGAIGEGQLGVAAASETVTILNTNPLAASVVLTLNYSTGSSYRRTISAPALKRTTVNLASLPGITPGAPFSLSYESNRNVTLDLVSLSFNEGTGAAFSLNAATQWLFGEGFRQASNPNRTRDYLRVFNPAPADTQISIKIVYNTGDSETFFLTAKARAASHFNLHDFITGARRNSNAFFSVMVQSPTPIATFFAHFDNNLASGFGTPGTPLGSTGSLATSPPAAS